MTADDDSDFARMLPGVKRLHSDRVNLYRQRKPNSPGRTLQRNPQPPSSIDYQHTESARDSHFNHGLQVKLQRKIRKGVIRPEATLDLHGYRRDEAMVTLEEFLAFAIDQRLRMVLVIHGQGYRSANEAVLKPMVQRWLEERPEVLAWCPAQPRDGAGGASYVYLRNS